MLDTKNLVHANGYHMKVIVEPLINVCRRMKDSKTVTYKKLVIENEKN